MTLSLGAGRIPAFDNRRYMPVLLTRQGERHAMRELPALTREQMTPLFVVHPITRDPDTGQPKSTVADHLGKLAKSLAHDWGTGPALIDLRYVDTEHDAGLGVHPLVWFVARCADLGLPLTPVVSHEHPDSYRRAAPIAADRADTAVAIRLSPAEWVTLGTAPGDGHLLGLLADAGQTAEVTHLVLDVRDQIGTTVEITANAVRTALRGLPQAFAWSSVTVAGTGMPTGTAEVGRDGAADIPRLEWMLWRQLDGHDHRQPSFGDYAVQHPDPLSDYNPKFMDSSAQLRYTIPAHWHVVRGRGVKKSGNDQIHDLAAQVVNHPQYSGAHFSWGDRWLYDCAHRHCKPGTQSVWRKVTTNHHLSYVTDQLANLDGS